MRCGGDIKSHLENFMQAVFSTAIQAVFFLVVCCFVLYVALELRVLLISRKVEKRRLEEWIPDRQDTDDFFPPVSVLLPVCNEAAVVERLIDSVCRLRYPHNLLEILVLDDSSDETSELAGARVHHYATQGVPVRLLRRPHRKQYKAGNLRYGIEHSKGELFAIFDADFVPPADFLLRTVPCFRDERLGFLQTGIGFENRDHSFLTRFQAMEMGHQQYVTVGLSEDGDMASLSGSSCVWRRSCVESLGGWNASTVTEDVDLGYRAQFGNWKYAYLRDVVSMSILPDTASAFRVQRERWGRGLIHSAFKHVRQMMAQPMPLMKRLHAVAMMFSALLLASIYMLFILTLPLNWLVDFDRTVMNWVSAVFVLMATVWALDNAFGAYKGARLQDRPSVGRFLWETYLYVAMFLPMAWHYFAGSVRAMCGVYGEFHRTPKGGPQETLPPIHRVLLAGEVFSFVYSVVALCVAVTRGNYFFVPVNVTACVGFGMMLGWSVQERR